MFGRSGGGELEFGTREGEAIFLVRMVGEIEVDVMELGALVCGRGFCIM